MLCVVNEWWIRDQVLLMSARMGIDPDYLMVVDACHLFLACCDDDRPRFLLDLEQKVQHDANVLRFYKLMTLKTLRICFTIMAEIGR